MRIMLDTNVLISMIFFPSKQMNELKHKLCKQHSIVLCPYIVNELQTVVGRKFAAKAKSLEKFFENLPFDLVNTPKSFNIGKYPKVRDERDTPVLAMAILDDVDILITGDKDFYDVDVERPEILSPSDFLEKY